MVHWLLLAEPDEPGVTGPARPVPALLVRYSNPDCRLTRHAAPTPSELWMSNSVVARLLAPSRSENVAVSVVDDPLPDAGEIDTTVGADEAAVIKDHTGDVAVVEPLSATTCQ